MLLPTLLETKKNKRQIISFGGINRTDNYQEGELAECKNLSSERFPALYPSKKDVSLWREDGLTDVFWHKKGYLSIINNKVSFTRYVEKEKTKLCEEGWRPCFTYTGATHKTSVSYLFVKDDVTINSDYALLEGEYICFKDKSDALFEVTGGGTADYDIRINKTDTTGTVAFSSLGIVSGDKIYRYCHGGDYLTVVDASEGSRTVAIREPLEAEEIENLRGKQLKIDDTEIYVTEGQNYNGITYLTFDRDISSDLSDSRIYLYEAYPVDNDFTERTELIEEPTGTEFCDKEYVLYKDTYTGALSEGKREIVSSGDCICIFPDKIMYDLGKLMFSEMEEKRVCYPSDTNSWEFGTDYFMYTPNSFKDYGFEVGDAVSFYASGLKNDRDIEDSLKSNCITAVIRDIDYDNDKLIFNSNTFAAYTPSLDVKIIIRREVPDLEHLCSRNGRLYGVEKNIIHVSKYNSPQNFKFFQGGASDSYYIEVSSPGEFTASVPYSSYILFFKEKEIIKLYGEKPSEFQIVSTSANGVMKGSERSVAEINGVIYYLGIDGVYAYSGSYPFKISKKLFDEGLSGGVATRNGSLYILSARTKTGEYKTYTYDTENGIWLTEERGEVVKYLMFNDKNACLKGTELYLLSEGERGEFFAEFCPINENDVYKKKYQRFYLRAELSEGARLIVEVSFDNAPFREIKQIFPSKRQVINIPIFPNRYDTVKIRLLGKGEVKVLSLMREFVEGSEK